MMALRIGRIEAAMVWFEERQDGAKEKMYVTLDDMAWEKRMTRVLLEKAALCEEHLKKIKEYLAQEEVAREEEEKLDMVAPALNVSQLPSKDGMVVASGSGSTWSPLQLAPSPIPEVVMIPPTPPNSHLNPSSSPPQQSPPAIQPPKSAQVDDIGHGSASVSTTFKEPTHPANLAIPRNDKAPAPCPTNTTGVVAVKVPLDDAIPKQSVSGHISQEPMSPSGQELAPEPLPLQMPPSPPWHIPNNKPQDKPMPPSFPSPIPDMQPLQPGNYCRPQGYLPPTCTWLWVG